MKRILGILLLIFIFFGNMNFYVFAESNNSKYFIVTAYYSPLPDQEYYLKGNYKAELKLNGMGIRGASGKGVFSGMLAAPKNYQFGTKIKLEGLGIGSVEDRGGAIVNAGNRGYKNDRIDVWMGYGDEGLRRALYWGKRKVKGTFLPNDFDVTININNISSPFWVTKNLKNISNSTKLISQIKKENDLLNIFNKSLKINSNKSDITLLQERLKELSLYDGNLNGKYNDIIDIIINYQLSKKLINSKNSIGAGYFGPKTRSNLKKDYEEYLLIKKREEERKKYLLQVFEELTKKSENKSSEIMNYIGLPVYGDISSGVRELQKTLKKLGNFNYNDTAIFGDITKQSIIDFQLENNVILSIDDIGSGIFGPKTREALKISLKKQLLNELLIKQEINKDELVDILDVSI